MRTSFSIVLIACSWYYYSLLYESQADLSSLRSRTTCHFHLKKKKWLANCLQSMTSYENIWYSNTFESSLSPHFVIWCILFPYEERCTTEITHTHYYSYQLKCSKSASCGPSNASRTPFTQMKEIMIGKSTSYIHPTLVMEVNHQEIRLLKRNLLRLFKNISKSLFLKSDYRCRVPSLCSIAPLFVS